MMKKSLRYCFLVAAILVQMAVDGIMAQEIYSIAPVSFNTRDYDEFSLLPYKDGYVFCTNRTPNAFIYRLDSLDKPLLDLYFVKRKPNTRWFTPSFFSQELNSKYHEGPFTFTNNYQTIYFTRNSRNTRGIFSASKGTLDWGEVSPFQYNDEEYSTAHPCITPDGSKMFFVSNKPTGSGGFDIYVCNSLSNGNWDAPRNLGPDVNSNGDELYPFYANNNCLYFSSNRKGGHGKLDIYYTLQINGKWIRPVLLPIPINSRENDFAFYPDSSCRHGFFATDRATRLHFSDIQEYTMNFPEFKDVKPIEANDYTYEFYEQSQINTDTTTFKYEWDFGDGKKLRGRELQVLHTFAKPGDYLVQLNVIDTITNNTVLNQVSNLFPVRDNEQPYITCVDTATVETEINFDALKTYLPEKKLLEYYWDFGDGQIGVGKALTHTYQYAGKYKVILGITIQGENNAIELDSRYKEILIQPTRLK